MTDSAPDNSDWDACPEGQIAQIAQESRERRRSAERSHLLQAGTSIAMILLIAAGSFFFFQATSDSNSSDLIADVTCEQCAEQGEAYLRHELSPELTAQIANHLEHCKRCDDYYANLSRELGLSISQAFEQMDSFLVSTNF